MLIAQGTLNRNCLAGKTAVITGGGSGIGFEAACSLAWLGANIVLAEIKRPAGKSAAAAICREMGRNCAEFIHTDVGSSRSVRRLAHHALRSSGRVDIILNNATIAPLGAAIDVAVSDWDNSYRVNLRGPLLLAQAFLPGMLARNSGVFVTVSSYGLAYMGAYEIFKKAQSELCNTLEAENEDSGVYFFSIGPGVVPTPTYLASLPKLAAMYGKSPQDFSAMVENQLISVEAAGAGFAAAVALAEKFHGQEIGSSQALTAAGIEVPQTSHYSDREHSSAAVPAQALPYIEAVRRTLEKQVADWKQRSLFEQQWCIRDFKKTSSLPAEKWLDLLQAYAQSAAGEENHLPLSEAPWQRLEDYYRHLYDMARGYIKDSTQREEHLRIVQGWQDEVTRLRHSLAAEHPDIRG